MKQFKDMTQDDLDAFDAAISDLQAGTSLGNTAFAELLERTATCYREMAKVEGE